MNLLTVLIVFGIISLFAYEIIEISGMDDIGITKDTLMRTRKLAGIVMFASGILFFVVGMSIIVALRTSFVHFYN